MKKFIIAVILFTCLEMLWKEERCEQYGISGFRECSMWIEGFR